MAVTRVWVEKEVRGLIRLIMKQGHCMFITATFLLLVGEARVQILVATLRLCAKGPKPAIGVPNKVLNCNDNKSQGGCIRWPI